MSLFNKKDNEEYSEIWGNRRDRGLVNTSRRLLQIEKVIEEIAKECNVDIKKIIASI
jgi:methenyltetrahydromethanopterin cyclohydrolase